MKIGELLKKAIEKSPFTVLEVAESINTTPQNLYKLFKKEHIDTKYLYDIGKVLSIPISSFFEGSETEKQSLNDDENNLLKKLKKENVELKAKVVDLQERLDDKKMILDLLYETGAISLPNLTTPKNERGINYDLDLNDPEALLKDIQNRPIINPKDQQELMNYLKKLIEIKKKKR